MNEAHDRTWTMNAIAVILASFCTVSDASAAYSYPQRMAYRSFLPELEETANFAKMGITLRTVFIANTVSANGRSYCQYPPVWRNLGDYDFAQVDAQLGDIIQASPQAEFIIMLDLNTPAWLTRRVRHDSFNEITHALSSPIYREEASKYLDQLVRYIEKGYGERVQAYILMNGHTSEWFERDLRQSHVKNLAWRKWCAERGLKYGLSTPTESDLATGAFEGTVYDPATEQEKIDFWKFHSWIISDGVLHFAHIAKKASGGKCIGASYGYYMICDKDPCGVGNLDYERVVADPGFDMITSPSTYSGREIGGGTGSMLVAGTSRRYGKRFYYSIDQWPHSLQSPYFYNICFRTLADTVAGNTRNAAFALVQHADFHWFDMWGGFYKDPEMKERIRRIVPIQKRFANDDSPPCADVLIVADPDSAYGRIDPRMAANEELGRKQGAHCPEGFVPAYGCGEEFRNRINHIGVSYDVVSFNDLPHIDLKPFRAVVLSEVWTISPEKEKVLRDHVLKDGRTIVWAYAPGVSDGRSVDAKRIRRWAGVDFKTPGVTTTAMGGWNAVYAYDHRILTPEKFREIFEAAGCHIWMDDHVPVMANGKLLAIHVKDGGRKAVRLPRKCAKVVDLIGGRTVATDCTAFEDDFATPDTKIYEMVAE